MLGDSDQPLAFGFVNRDFISQRFVGIVKFFELKFLAGLQPGLIIHGLAK